MINYIKIYNRNRKPDEQNIQTNRNKNRRAHEEHRRNKISKHVQINESSCC